MEPDELVHPDFWWLDRHLNADMLKVSVAVSPPIGPLDDAPGLTHFEEPVLISSLTEWASTHPKMNLHRSVDVYQGRQVVQSGPFVIDIDADSMEGGTQRDARPAAVQTVHYLLDNGVTAEELRLLDSGQKGYNVEIHPTARLNGRRTDHAGFCQAIIRALRQMNRITSSTQNQVADAVVIDGWKPYVRLWNSPNAWLDSDRRYQERFKQEISLNNL